jgi:hypothetical protein
LAPAVKDAGESNDMSGPDSTTGFKPSTGELETQPVERDGAGRFADSQAATVAAELRWAEGKGPLPPLDSLPAAKKLLAEVVRAGLREVRRLRRASEPVPGSLLASISRSIDSYVKCEICERDTGTLAETRRLLREVQARQRRGLPSGVAR